MTEFDQCLDETAGGIRRLMRSFTYAVLALLLIAGLSLAVSIDSAVLAEGAIEVRSSAQEVEHPDGGVIADILVSEGDAVATGQVLIRLDGAAARTEVALLDKRRIDLTVERARLEAERDGRTRLTRPELAGLSAELRLAFERAITLNQTLLATRVAAMDSRISQHQQRLRQTQNSIAGLERVRDARLVERARIAEELSAVKALFKRGYSTKPRLRAVQRDAARIDGDIGDIESRIASETNRKIEIDLKIKEIEREAQSAALDRLKATAAELSEVETRHAAATLRLSRLDIRAPRAGVVHELAVRTVGGVAGRGERLMSIIPQDEPLTITARIKALDIDQVRVGQPATVKLSSLPRSNAEELDAQIVGLSPAQSEDDRSGEPYFSARLSIRPEEWIKLDGYRPVPGEHAQVTIIGDRRAVLSYLIGPIADQMSQAFREQ